MATVVRALKRPQPEQFEFVAQEPPTRTVHVLLQLPPRQARELLHQLPDAPNLAILGVLDPEIRERLLDATVTENVAAALAELDDQSAADIVSGLPPDLIARLLARHPHSAEISASVARSARSAGSAMR